MDLREFRPEGGLFCVGKIRSQIVATQQGFSIQSGEVKGGEGTRNAPPRNVGRQNDTTTGLKMERKPGALFVQELL